MPKRYTTEQFETAARKVHGDTYDYSHVDYKNTSTKVKIICKKHGGFEQLPSNHLSGARCKKCKLESQTKTTEQFIRESILLHGDKYDYSYVAYKSAHTKVKIICKKHGAFEQIPSSHINGKGCAKCYAESQTKTKEQFIYDAIKVHGDVYDYSQADYKNTSTKVKIICKKHGAFEQIPSRHVHGGDGCKKCSIDLKTKLTEQFIQESILLHGDKYDYSHVDYIFSRKKVKIICKKHGLFEQLPGGHLLGYGCKKCAFEKTTSLGEKEFLDELNIPESDRQFVIPSASYIADGIHKSTNTILEYLGDYWHGNPSTYAPSIKIRGTSKTCADVYKETFNRFAIIKSIGYNVKYIWESDWNAWKKNPDDPIPIKQF